MNPGIHFHKIWSDNDVVELTIDSSDGKSLFSNSVYVAQQTMDALITELQIFKEQVHGGIYDIALGSFGPEYGGGAFHARLHFQDRGKIYITVKAQSDFEEFGVKNVASEATLYMQTEPALLDNFIADLKALKAGKSDDAKLEAAVNQHNVVGPERGERVLQLD